MIQSFFFIIQRLRLLITAALIILIGGCTVTQSTQVKLPHPFLATIDHSIPNDAEQMIIVGQNAKDTLIHGVMFALEKKRGKWVKVFNDNIKVSLGRAGIVASAQKREGDGATPAGFYQLGQLFSYESTVDTRLPFIQVNSDDKWIDDSTSSDYNTYVRGATLAKSYENLLLASIDYKYCMVIEYNTHPVAKGKGSAIFFHITTKEYPATAGCVAVQESDMLRILSWLDPNKKKYIGIIP